MVIFIAKCSSRWHSPLFRFLEEVYGAVDVIYLNKEIRSRQLPSSGTALIAGLCDRVNNLSAKACIFDLEFSVLLAPDEVASVCKEVSCPTFGVALDDDRFHDINREVYAGVDGILTHPLCVERYRLIGYRAFDFFPSFELCRDQNLDKYVDVHDRDIDVLSYGLLKGDRKWVLEQLKDRGVNVYHPPFDTSDADLDALIRRSKIVINLSSGSSIANNPIQFLPFSGLKETRFPTRQLKSRIYEVAALGTLCISEDFAGDNLIFQGGGLVKVKGPSEMVDVINNLISDSVSFEEAHTEFLASFNSQYNLPKRVNEFISFVDGCVSKRQNSLKSGFLFNACSIATKCIYSSGPFPLFKFKAENYSMFKSFMMRILALVLITYSLGCALLKRP